MVKIVESYQCEKCNTKYKSRAIAEICEAASVPPKPNIVGAEVSFEVDHDKETDTIKDIFLVAPVMLHFAQGEETPDDARLSFLRSLKDTGRHSWHVRMDGYYYFDGDEILSFHLDELTFPTLSQEKE